MRNGGCPAGTTYPDDVSSPLVVKQGCGAFRRDEDCGGEIRHGASIHKHGRIARADGVLEQRGHGRTGLLRVDPGCHDGDTVVKEKRRLAEAHVRTAEIHAPNAVPAKVRSAGNGTGIAVHAIVVIQLR